MKVNVCGGLKCCGCGSDNKSFSKNMFLRNYYTYDKIEVGPISRPSYWDSPCCDDCAENPLNKFKLVKKENGHILSAPDLVKTKMNCPHCGKDI